MAANRLPIHHMFTGVFGYFMRAIGNLFAGKYGCSGDLAPKFYPVLSSLQRFF